MKTTLTAIALFTVLATGATSVQAYCNTCEPAPVCNTCAPRMVRVEMEQVCAPCNTCCNPCGRSWSIFNPFSW